MILGLRNATRYLYKKAGTMYEQLLDMAIEAELEFSESKRVSARIKSVGVVEKADASKIQEFNNRIDNFTATLKASNLKPKSASAPSSPTKSGTKMVMNPQSQKVWRSPAMDHLGEQRNLCSAINVGGGDMDGVNVLPWET